ncbi:MAG: hypothetical protein IPI46_06060 [Bacteroidetes bacterium]|nr:hypothetical protein [Bacteroidota bacterium]
MMRNRMIKVSMVIAILMQLVPFDLFAQKRIDQVIPDAEKRKVLRARKLYNQYKIYKGEQILKDLAKANPTIPYYHEALVQMQRQVLRHLRDVPAELESLAISAKADSLDKMDTDSSYAKHESMKSNIAISKKDTVEWDGFDSGFRAENVKKKKQVIEEKDPEEITEAVVTIDSTLLEEDFAGDDINLPLPNLKRDKSLEKQLKSLSELAQIPYESYRDDFIRNCRKATLQVEYADSASWYLREFLIDTLALEMPSNPVAIESFERGIEAFTEKLYKQAEIEFKKSIELFPAYYEAYMHLAETAYHIGKDSLAIANYHLAIQLQPLKTEPWENLSKLYEQQGKYKQSANAIISAICVYPQQHFMQSLKRIVQKDGLAFKSQWIPREVYPLSMASNYFEIAVTEKSPWWFYQMADQELRCCTDTSGVIQTNEITKEKYLEVYAWNKMLDSTSKDSFLFARAMRKAGFLDCYTLITCFHNDLYLQYADLVKKYPEKVKEYFYMLINWDNKKFDKLRNQFLPPKGKKK